MINYILKKLGELMKRVYIYFMMVKNRLFFISYTIRKTKILKNRFINSLIGSKKNFIKTNIRHFDKSKKSEVVIFLSKIIDYEEKFSSQNCYSLKAIEEDEKKIFNSLKSIKNSFLNIEYLFILHDYFSLKGRFVIANYFRELALDKSIDFKISKLKPISLFYKFKAFVDIGKFDEAITILNHIKRSYLRLILPFKDLENFLNLFNNPDNITAKMNPNDYEYFNFIENKKIAILGPLKDEIYSKNEFDEFDIIIRMNYEGLDKLPYKNANLGKNFLSYYNPHKVDKILHEKNEVLDSLEFSIVKSKDDMRKLTLYTKKTKLRIAKYYDYFSFMGIYNMSQIIVQDLIHFKPELIKFFNINFFTKLNYQNYYRIENSNMSKGLTMHNQITQINLFKNLKKNNKIEFDDVTNDVLKLEKTEYLKKLESTFVIK